MQLYKNLWNFQCNHFNFVQQCIQISSRIKSSMSIHTSAFVSFETNPIFNTHCVFFHHITTIQHLLLVSDLTLVVDILMQSAVELYRNTQSWKCWHFLCNSGSNKWQLGGLNPGLSLSGRASTVRPSRHWSLSHLYHLKLTRMPSSRMRTGRTLTISGAGGGGCIFLGGK